MKRTGFAKADCPVARALDAIGDWWSLLIVRDAFDGLRRFGDFQKNLGIAKGMLTTRLRTLVELGVLEQVAASDGSAYHEYVLTKRGHDLFPVVVGLRQWGEAHLSPAAKPIRCCWTRPGRRSANSCCRRRAASRWAGRTRR